MKAQETIGRPYGVPLLTKKGLEGLEEGGRVHLWDGEQLGDCQAAGSACGSWRSAHPGWGQVMGCQVSLRMGCFVVWGANCYRLKEVCE